MPDYNELEIEIFPNTNTSDTYTVKARSTVPHPGRPRETMKVDLYAPEIEGPLEKIEHGETDEQLFKAFGGLLFRTLFVGGIRDAYIANLANAQVKDRFGRTLKEGVRIRFQIEGLQNEEKQDEEASPLYKLPWMLMYDPDREWWLGGTNVPQTPLSYDTQLNEPVLFPLTLPLKILVVTPNPIKLPPIDSDAELKKIRAALQKHIKQGNVEIEVLSSSVTMENLEGRLAVCRPHILHFIGHGPQGRPTAFSSPGVFLEDEDRNPYFCPLSVILGMLGGIKGTLRFVVLNACNSDGAAWKLARHGFPAVGMRYDIYARAAEPFSHRLYEAIGAGSPVDEAVNRSRSAIRQNYGDQDRDWFAPALFLSHGKADLFDVPWLKKGAIKVNSTPEGARIFLEAGGEFEDQYWETPNLLYVDVGHDYTVEVKKQGYKPQQKVVSVASIGTFPISFNLEPEHHPILHVRSFPSKAEVIVNGVPRPERTPTSLRVIQGFYQVRVEKRGFLFWSKQRKIEVVPPMTREFFILIPLISMPKLEPLSRPRWLWLLFLPLLALGGQHLWVAFHRAPPGMIRMPAGQFIKGEKETPLIRVMRKLSTDWKLRLLIEDKPKRGWIERGFYLDRYEVTKREYGSFLRYMRATKDHGQCHQDEPPGKDHTPSDWRDDDYNRPEPVVGVDWYDAYAYAAWAGKRLPAGDEWERAARGTNGRLYPWGNDFDEKKCNTGEGPEPGPVEGGQYEEGKSPEGVYDLVGNVSEWTDESKQIDDQQGRVTRGGAWNRPGETYGLAFFKREATLGYRGRDVGFRCTQDATSSGAPPERMVYIPPGEFQKGSEDSFLLNLAREHNLSESAVRRLIEEKWGKVSLGEFYLDAHEVTNQEYRKFLEQGAKSRKQGSSEEKGSYPGDKNHQPESKFWNDSDYNQPDQPVIGIDWYDAEAYCRSMGKRLPTEDEWERAARGTDGRRYPWGNEFDPGKCNSGESPHKTTVAVGNKDCKSPAGIYDLVGNADEWTSTTRTDGKDIMVVIRGGSWRDSGELRGLGYFKSLADPEVQRDIGIRCAADPRRSWWEKLRG